jgi:hypothetical protein
VRPEDVPARPWLTADAERWAAARLPFWAQPQWPALALVVAVFLAAVVLSPDEVCTVSAPCGPEWDGAVVTFLFACHAGWLWLLPELAVVSAPLLLWTMTDRSLWVGGTGEKAADIAVVAVLCWSWASAGVRLRVRRRQRALALDSAGGLTFPAPVRKPGSRRPPRSSLAFTAAVLVLLAVSAAATALAVSGFRSDEVKAAAATRTPAVVLANGSEDTITVRFTGGGPAGRHRIEALYPEDHAVDSTVPVLVKGSWMRLAAEPYRERFGLQSAALAAGSLAITLLAYGLLAATRTRALGGGAPTPALRVQARRRHGRTHIYAADDTGGQRPLLTYEPFGGTASSLGEAVLYGAPHEGAEVVLLRMTTSGVLAMEMSAFPARQEGPQRRRAQDRALYGERTKSARLRRDKETEEAEILVALATMGPAKGPVRWKGGPVARIFGALMVCVAAGMFTGLLLDADRNDISHWLGALFGGSMAAVTALPPLTWRITADAAGLRIRRYGRSRQLPWADVTRAVYADGGHLIVRTRSGLDDINLGSVGFPPAERAFGVPARAACAATEITAMVRDPGLRPL